ncbi:hypothetical protein GCM10028807_33670 [Spirosoma daeguense]
MTSLLERLKIETRPLHEETEQLLYSDSLRNGTLSAENYQHLLRTHLAFHKALEEEIDLYPDFFQDYAPDTRRKTPWLVADLSIFTENQILADSVFADWTPEALLGATYVGEGSMLGGKTVWHYLQQSPDLRPLLSDARFYQGYGAETGLKWRDFGVFLTNREGDQADQIVEGARQAFRTYQHLFQWTSEQ